MSPVTSPIQRFRVLAGALMGALVVIGIALTFVVSGSHTTSRTGATVVRHAPATWVYVVIVALGVVSAVLVSTVGYRVPALPPGLDPAASRARSVALFQQSMVLRFAISETVAIVSIAVLFVADSDTVLPYVVGGVISLLLMAWHVWPGSRVIDRVARSLDRAGGRSDLAQVLEGTA